MRSTRATLRLLLAVLFLLGLAACGDSDDDDGGDAAPDPTEAPAGSEDDGGGEDGGASGDAVTITDFSYEPEDLAVEAGTTVTWTNDEGEPVHTVTSDDDAAAEFDSDDIGSGETFEFTFEDAGDYPYVCKIHASMNGTVTVE